MTDTILYINRNCCLVGTSLVFSVGHVLGALKLRTASESPSQRFQQGPVSTRESEL